jgi:hypothetical protein
MVAPAHANFESRMEPSVNVFFVCGAPKSGTTWLQRILDAHPEVCCSGEGHFVERFTAPLARVLNAYNTQLSLEIEQVYEGEPIYGPVDQSELDDLGRAFILRRLTSRAAPGVQWVGDKTPRYTHQLQALDRLFPQARFINIVRDPRDVAVSRMGHSRRIGLTEVFTPGTAQNKQAIEDAVSGWIEALRLVDAFARSHPGRVRELRYWELVERPAETAADLFEFLGVSTAQPTIEAVVAATSFEALSGRKPGEEDAGAFLRNGVPGDWRKHLGAEAVAAIEAACGELMREKALPSPRARRSA